MRPASKQCPVRPSTQQALRNSGDKWRFITDPLKSPSSPFNTRSERTVESDRMSATVTVAPSLLASLEAISPNASWLSTLRASQLPSPRWTPQRHDLQPVPPATAPAAATRAVVAAGAAAGTAIRRKSPNEKRNFVPSTPKTVNVTPPSPQASPSSSKQGILPPLSPPQLLQQAQPLPSPPKVERSARVVRFKVGKKKNKAAAAAAAKAERENDESESSPRDEGGGMADMFVSVGAFDGSNEGSSMSDSRLQPPPPFGERKLSGSGLFTPKSPIVAARKDSMSPGDMRRWRMRQYRRRSTHSLLSVEADPADPFVYFARAVQGIRDEFDFHEDDELRQLDDLVDELKHADLPLLFSRGHPMAAEALSGNNVDDNKPPAPPQTAVSSSQFFEGSLPPGYRSLTAAPGRNDGDDESMADPFSPQWDVLTEEISCLEGQYLKESLAELELLGLANAKRSNAE